MAPWTFSRSSPAVLFMAFLAESVSCKLEAVELGIVHIIFVVTENTFFDFHAFEIRRLGPLCIFPVMALFAGVIFLVPPMGKAGEFNTVRTFELHLGRSCISRSTGPDRSQKSSNKQYCCQSWFWYEIHNTSLVVAVWGWQPQCYPIVIGPCNYLSTFHFGTI